MHKGFLGKQGSVVWLDPKRFVTGHCLLFRVRMGGYKCITLYMPRVLYLLYLN